MKNLVSIAIVTYNQVSFIQETLDSALNQDYEPLEVIVADDGSSDGTDEIIHNYASQNPGRLIALTGGPNLGITGNSNRALKGCKGKYIAFQGGDDILLPHKISRQVEWMEGSKERKLCGHDVEIFDSRTGQKIALWSDSHPLHSGQGAADIVHYGVPYAATSVMVRSDAIPSYGFDARVPVVSDWKLWIDCLADEGEFGFIDGVYARYRISGTNASHNRLAMNQDTLITLALTEWSYPHLIKHCKYQRALAYYDLGIDFLKKNEYVPARQFFIAAMQTALTASWKPPIAWLFTHLPKNWNQTILEDRPVPRSLMDFMLSVIKKKK